MSGYLTEDERESSRKVKIVLAAVVGFVLLLIAGVYALARLDPGLLQRAMSPRMTGEDVAAEIHRNPLLRSAYAEFRANYPREYRAFMDRLAVVANTEGRAAADRESHDLMRAFITAKIEAIASAPDEDLMSVARAEASVLDALSETDTALCGQYAIAGFSYGVRLPPAVMAELVELTRLTIRAAHWGESRRRVVRGPLSREDAAAWFAGIEEIDAGLASKISDGSITRSPPQEQCAAGVALYRAVTALPDQVGARVMAHLLRNAIAMQQAGN